VEKWKSGKVERWKGGKVQLLKRGIVELKLIKEYLILVCSNMPFN
jgi:hypothetical protein